MHFLKKKVVKEGVGITQWLIVAWYMQCPGFNLQHEKNKYKSECLVDKLKKS